MKFTQFAYDFKNYEDQICSALTQKKKNREKIKREQPSPFIPQLQIDTVFNLNLSEHFLTELRSGSFFFR